jgi:hypothetical protein
LPSSMPGLARSLSDTFTGVGGVGGGAGTHGPAGPLPLHLRPRTSAGATVLPTMQQHQHQQQSARMSSFLPLGHTNTHFNNSNNSGSSHAPLPLPLPGPLPLATGGNAASSIPGPGTGFRPNPFAAPPQSVEPWQTFDQYDDNIIVFAHFGLADTGCRRASAILSSGSLAVAQNPEWRTPEQLSLRFLYLKATQQVDALLHSPRVSNWLEKLRRRQDDMMI